MDNVNPDISNDSLPILHPKDFTESLNNLADLPNYLEKINQNIMNIEKRISKKELNTENVNNLNTLLLNAHPNYENIITITDVNSNNTISTEFKKSNIESKNNKKLSNNKTDVSNTIGQRNATNRLSSTLTKTQAKKISEVIKGEIDEFNNNSKSIKGKKNEENLTRKNKSGKHQNQYGYQHQYQITDVGSNNNYKNKKGLKIDNSLESGNNTNSNHNTNNATGDKGKNKKNIIGNSSNNNKRNININTNTNSLINSNFTSSLPSTNNRIIKHAYKSNSQVPMKDTKIDPISINSLYNPDDIIEEKTLKHPNKNNLNKKPINNSNNIHSKCQNNNFRNSQKLKKLFDSSLTNNSINIEDYNINNFNNIPEIISNNNQTQNRNNLIKNKDGLNDKKIKTTNTLANNINNNALNKKNILLESYDMVPKYKKNKYNDNRKLYDKVGLNNNNKENSTNHSTSNMINNNNHNKLMNYKHLYNYKSIDKKNKSSCIYNNCMINQSTITKSKFFNEVKNDKNNNNNNNMANNNRKSYNKTYTYNNNSTITSKTNLYGSKKVNSNNNNNKNKINTNNINTSNNNNKLNDSIQSKDVKALYAKDFPKKATNNNILELMLFLNEYIINNIYNNTSNIYNTSNNKYKFKDKEKQIMKKYSNFLCRLITNTNNANNNKQYKYNRNICKKYNSDDDSYCNMMELENSIDILDSNNYNNNTDINNDENNNNNNNNNITNLMAKKIQNYWRKYKIEKIINENNINNNTNNTIKSEIKKMLFNSLYDSDTFNCKKIFGMFNMSMDLFIKLKNKDGYINNICNINNNKLMDKNKYLLYKEYINQYLSNNKENNYNNYNNYLYTQNYNNSSYVNYQTSTLLETLNNNNYLYDSIISNNNLVDKYRNSVNHTNKSSKS